MQCKEKKSTNYCDVVSPRTKNTHEHFGILRTDLYPILIPVKFIWIICLWSPIILWNIIFYFQRNFSIIFMFYFPASSLLTTSVWIKNACLLDQLAAGKRWMMEVFADEVALCGGQDWRVYLLIWDQWCGVEEWAGVHFHCMRSSTCKSPDYRQGCIFQVER